MKLFAEGFSRSTAAERTWPWLLDAAVFGAAMAAFYGVILIGRYWLGTANPNVEISHSPWALPGYAFYSLVRMGVAYAFSLAFALGYGYLAAYNKRLQPFLLAALDVLQSIPVLSFLPGVMLAMVALFPTKQFGLELGSILLIFTGQVWNMAFSFYASLQAIPRELREAARIGRFSRFQTFFQLELPYGAIGLVWNSMVSVAGGWFFLMACEMFELRKRDFRLPGLGSYLQTAASAGDMPSVFWGLAVMIAVIVLLDQVVWRPAIAWADKFKFEQVESAAPLTSPVLHLLRNANLLKRLNAGVVEPLSERLYARFANGGIAEAPAKSSPWRVALVLVSAAAALGAVVFALVQAFLTIRGVHGAQWLRTLEGAGATFLRVNVALLIASLWTIPAGVAIGFHPRLARLAQPLAEIAASVPATALFPVLLLILAQAGGGLGVGSILLMLLGTQWYILFNVIAGAMAIPSDLREVAAVFRFPRGERWRTVILPGIFPYLITGLVTASGGAWNASIIAEYFHFKGTVWSTLGLGAQISQASDSGDFALLLLSTIVMAGMVVSINRLVWRPLYRLGETRYRLEG